MKKRGWAVGLFAGGCIALALFGQNSQGGADMIYALALPFVWTGAGLRALSLSGWAGNVLAILLYVAASLLPMWPMIKKSRRPKVSLSRLLLIAMSGYLFFLMYFMVNPSMIQTLFQAGMGSFKDMQQAMLCVYFYSLLIASWIISVMADVNRIPLQLRRMIVVLGALMIVSVFYINVANLRGALAALPAASQEDFSHPLDFPVMRLPGSPPAFDGFIAVLRFAFDSAPTLLLLTVLPMADRLLKSLEQSFFSEENQRYAAAIAGRCRLVILVSLGGMLIMGALQLLLSKWLANVHLTGEVPILMLAVSLAMMLLSRYLERSFKVYRENQMMI